MWELDVLHRPEILPPTPRKSAAAPQATMASRRVYSIRSWARSSLRKLRSEDINKFPLAQSCPKVLIAVSPQRLTWVVLVGIGTTRTGRPALKPRAAIALARDWRRSIVARRGDLGRRARMNENGVRGRGWRIRIAHIRHIRAWRVRVMESCQTRGFSAPSARA